MRSDEQEKLAAGLPRMTHVDETMVCRRLADGSYGLEGSGHRLTVQCAGLVRLRPGISYRVHGHVAETGDMSIAIDEARES
jgi:hypothetical protein